MSFLSIFELATDEGPPVYQPTLHDTQNHTDPSPLSQPLSHHYSIFIASLSHPRAKKKVHNKANTCLQLSPHQMLPMLLDQRQPHDRHLPSSSSCRRQMANMFPHHPFKDFISSSHFCLFFSFSTSVLPFCTAPFTTSLKCIYRKKKASLIGL